MGISYVDEKRLLCARRMPGPTDVKGIHLAHPQNAADLAICRALVRRGLAEETTTPGNSIWSHSTAPRLTVFRVRDCWWYPTEVLPSAPAHRRK